jgi:hypothetical protein
MQSDAVYKGRSIIQVLAIHLFYVESIVPVRYYFALLYAGVDKLKHLIRIGKPMTFNDRKAYLACVMVYRKSLTRLTISDNVNNDKATDEEGNKEYIARNNSRSAQYNLLCDQLDQFNQLTRIDINKEPQQLIDSFEDLLTKCKLLETLSIYYYYGSENFNVQQMPIIVKM